MRTAHATDEDVRAQAGEAEWFMDYRNADGSLAQMCGNGTRVFAEYLRREGLAFGASFSIATRAGVKTVRVVEQGYAVDLGPWRLVDEEGARRDGFDVMVRPRHGKPVPALSLDLGNPHAVVMLPEGITLEHLDLSEAPQLHPEPADGANVEFVRAVGPGHIAMRVHERGRRRDAVVRHRRRGGRPRDPLLVGGRGPQPLDRRRAGWAPDGHAPSGSAGRARRPRGPRRGR